MLIQHGLLHGVRYVPSPHCNDRPADMPIDMIVIHGISLPPGEFGGAYIEAFFTGTLNYAAHPYFDTLRELRVSAHVVIDRAGCVTQFVPFDKRAWHAGDSFFDGRVRCNDFSIGIELEGTDEVPYEMAQYITLAKLIEVLQATYPAITSSRIVGHCDIAPGRKTDPGESFDWSLLGEMLQSSPVGYPGEKEL